MPRFCEAIEYNKGGFFAKLTVTKYSRASGLRIICYSVNIYKFNYFVSIHGENSYLFDLLLGTLQGSVLGPVLYALFVSPLFEIVPALSFADDSHNMKTSKDE